MLEKKFPLVSVSPGELDGWFMSLPGTETTRAMFFRYTRMFFRWAHRMEYVARDPSAALDAPKAAVGRNILTVEQMRAVLSVEMDGWLFACILLGAFAGSLPDIMKIDRLIVKSSGAPTLEVDHEAGAAYLRFRRGKVARAVPRGGSGAFVSIDLDRSGDVLGGGDHRGSCHRDRPHPQTCRRGCPKYRLLPPSLPAGRSRPCLMIMKTTLAVLRSLEIHQI